MCGFCAASAGLKGVWHDIYQRGKGEYSIINAVFSFAFYAPLATESRTEQMDIGNVDSVGRSFHPPRSFLTSPILMVTFWASKYSISGMVYLRLAPVISLNCGVVISPFSFNQAVRRSCSSAMTAA